MPSHRIICKTCAKSPLGEYPGEWARRVSGLARKDFVCDQCNVDISEGTPCVAESFGVDRVPYTPWEQKYVNVGGSGPCSACQTETTYWGEHNGDFPVRLCPDHGGKL